MTYLSKTDLMAAGWLEAEADEMIHEAKIRELQREHERVKGWLVIAVWILGLVLIGWGALGTTPPWARF